MPPLRGTPICHGAAKERATILLRGGRRGPILVGQIRVAVLPVLRPK